VGWLSIEHRQICAFYVRYPYPVYCCLAISYSDELPGACRQRQSAGGHELRLWPFFKKVSLGGKLELNDGQASKRDAFLDKRHE